MKAELFTKNNYSFDEVASALQKSIRRGLVRESVFWALELFESGYWKYAFRRLVTIAYEDIGSLEIVSLAVSTANFVGGLKNPPDECILAGLVKMMAEAPKCRENDELVNLVLLDRKEGRLLEVPDWAIDKHTKRGKELGRNEKDFWLEGAKLENEQPSRYKKELYQRLGLE